MLREGGIHGTAHPHRNSGVDGRALTTGPHQVVVDICAEVPSSHGGVSCCRSRLRLYTRPMISYSDASDFMSGFYVMDFTTPDDARRFVERYSACPVWPIVSQLGDRRRVFVLAVELRAQRHGDFSQESNTLVRHPEYVGAQRVLFRRDDALSEGLLRPSLQTGTASNPPCGSDCGRCSSYQEPCRGCPATLLFLAESGP